MLTVYISDEHDHACIQVSEEKELPGHFLSMAGGAALTGRRHSVERQSEAVMSPSV